MRGRPRLVEQVPHPNDSPYPILSESLINPPATRPSSRRGLRRLVETALPSLVAAAAHGRLYPVPYRHPRSILPQRARWGGFIRDNEAWRMIESLHTFCTLVSRKLTWFTNGIAVGRVRSAKKPLMPEYQTRCPEISRSSHALDSEGSVGERSLMFAGALNCGEMRGGPLISCRMRGNAKREIFF